jgi:hypothetical protein
VGVSSGTAVEVVVGIAILALVIYRQLAVRRVRENYRLVIILAIIGIFELSNFLSSSGHSMSSDKIALALAGSAVLAALMGVLRALTVKIWRGGDGQLLRQGTWLTGALWLVAVVLHLGFDALVAGGFTTKGPNIGNATIVLYLAVTLGAQQAVLLRRADRQDAAQPAGTGVGAGAGAGEPQAPLS